MRKIVEMQSDEPAQNTSLPENSHIKRTRLRFSIPFVLNYESEIQTKNNTIIPLNVMRSMLRAINNGWIISFVSGLALIFIAKHLDYFLNFSN
jgi:hypothetical protein